MKRLPIPVLVGGGALLWGLVLVVVWAIHPVDSFSRYAPVENPSAAEQASINAVFAEFDGATPVLGNHVRCESSPFEAATGSTDASAAPSVPAGFEYVDVPCSSAYGDTGAAFWMNAIAIGAVVALCAAFSIRQRTRSSASPSVARVGPDRSVTT